MVPLYFHTQTLSLSVFLFCLNTELSVIINAEAKSYLHIWNHILMHAFNVTRMWRWDQCFCSFKNLFVRKMNWLIFTLSFNVLMGLLFIFFPYNISQSSLFFFNFVLCLISYVCSTLILSTLTYCQYISSIFCVFECISLFLSLYSPSNQ